MADRATARLARALPGRSLLRADAGRDRDRRRAAASAAPVRTQPDVAGRPRGERHDGARPWQPDPCRPDGSPRGPRHRRGTDQRAGHPGIPFSGRSGLRPRHHGTDPGARDRTRSGRRRADARSSGGIASACAVLQRARSHDRGSGQHQRHLRQWPANHRPPRTRRRRQRHHRPASLHPLRRRTARSPQARRHGDRRRRDLLRRPLGRGAQAHPPCRNASDPARRVRVPRRRQRGWQVDADEPAGRTTRAQPGDHHGRGCGHRPRVRSR